jgi:hypothetical protein
MVAKAHFDDGFLATRGSPFFVCKIYCGNGIRFGLERFRRTELYGLKDVKNL